MPRAAPALARPLMAAVTRLARGLSDPNRVEILRLIAAQRGPICACDIVEAIDLSQPTVSHHLKILREAGLIEATKQGLWTFYAIAPGARAALRGLATLV